MHIADNTTGHESKKAFGIAVALVVACLVLAVWACYGLATNATSEQAAQATRASILKAAQQCCAVEGSYPGTIGHLEESYGLHVNHDAFAITYESFAANVMPTVTVVAK